MRTKTFPCYWLLLGFCLIPATVRGQTLGGSIVFTHIVLGDPQSTQVFVVDKTGKTRQIAQLEGAAGCLRWSPDGRFIALSRVGRDDDIFVMNADGSNLRNLTGGAARERGPVWSPDGRQIAFIRYDGPQTNVWLMDATGENRRQISKVPAGYWDLDWSPDGQTILCSANRGLTQLWAMDVNGDDLRNVTNAFNTLDVYPRWSPDGRKIIWVAYQIGGNADIYTMNTDGTRQERLTNDSVFEVKPLWLSDGRHVAFVGNPDLRNELFVLDAVDKKVRKVNVGLDITVDGFDWYQPILSVAPVGKKAVVWGGFKQDRTQH